MGLGPPENVLRRTAGAEGLQDEELPGGLGAGGELAVRECAGAALPELHVALGIQDGVGLQGGHVPGALLDGLAALDEDGPGAGHGQG